LRGDEEAAAATGHDAPSLANRSSRTSTRNAGAFLRLSGSKCLARWRWKARASSAAMARRRCVLRRRAAAIL